MTPKLHTASWLLIALCATFSLAATCDDTQDNPPSNNANNSVPEMGVDAAPDMPMLDPLTPRFEPEGEGFYKLPWPNDIRLKEGKVDLSEFPNINQLILRVFRGALEKVEGFATMPVIYTSFDISVSTASMPAPKATLAADGAVQLIDVSAQGCGERVPVLVDMDSEGDAYIPANTLRVSPVPGFILKPKRAYAMVILKRFGAEDGLETQRPAAFDAVLKDDAAGALADVYKPLRDCLPNSGLSAEQIALATVFTTQDPVRETTLLRDAVLDPAQVKSPEITEWELVRDGGDLMNVYAGWFEAPIFQAGNTPYHTKGYLEFDEAGKPKVQRYERVPVTLALPKTLPQGKLPILLWSDGTGASQFSHLDDTIIKNLVRRGYGVLSFVPQFHDTRSPATADDPVAPTFNYLNPDSGRTTFRQQAAETIYMTRVITEALPKLPDMPELDGDRILYGGHSQGGIVGALVAGITDKFTAFALNGTGGYVSTTIVYRKDYVDIEKTLRNAVKVDRPLDRLHPIVQLAQLGIEVIDPHNYSPRWRGVEGDFDGSHVFVSNGGQDATTARLGIDAMTIAANMPPLQEAFWNLDPYGVWGVAPVLVPLQGNTKSVGGRDLTIATYLLDGQGHFTIYRVPRATNLFVDFWDSAYKGVPTLK